MTNVYILYHIISDENDPTADDEEKFIGVYSTEAKAKEAIDRLKPQPGFRDYPQCFEIFEHTLDKDSWTEGFISVEEATYGGREPVH